MELNNTLNQGEDNKIVSQSPKDLQKKIFELQEQARELKKMMPKKAKRKVLPQSIPDEDFEKILKQLDFKKRAQKENAIAFLLAYESGLRISEVLHLKREDVNINAKTIFVRQGKFSKDRVVPLPKGWKMYMLDFLPFKKGVRTLEKAFKNCVRQAGLNDRYHFHCLRHSFATHCLERGMPINQVQILIGHSSVGTTNVYIQANPIDAIAKYQEIY